MSTIPTPVPNLLDVRVRYNYSSGEILQEFRISQTVVSQLTDVEFEALLDSMDAGVLTYNTDPGQIQRIVEYNFSATAVVNTVIKVS